MTVDTFESLGLAARGPYLGGGGGGGGGGGWGGGCRHGTRHHICVAIPASGLCKGHAWLSRDVWAQSLVKQMLYL